MKNHFFAMFRRTSRSLATLLFLVFSVLSTAPVFGQFSFSDNASSYGGTWPNGSNFGTGYNAWSIATGGANAGTFIGNPSSNGMGTAGIGTTAFGLFGHSGTFVNAGRFFGAGGTNVPMQIGDVFSFHWAMNFDCGSSGSKGFDLRAGATTVFNVNNGNSATITTTNGNANTTYGTDAMLVTLTRTSWTQYSFSMTSRSGGATYNTTITSSLDINNINIYCGAQQDNNGNRNIYFNNFNFTKAAPYETNFSLTDTRILTGSSNLTKTGTGNLTLNAANTFSGNTIINANSLIVNNDNNFGAVPGSATTDKIQIGNGTLGINTTLTINANRGITVSNAASTIDVAAAQTGTYNGIIAGSGGVTKTGTGTLVLGGVSTYSGNTTLSAGTLQLGTANVIPNASNVVMSGGTLSTGATTGNAETMGTLQLTANSTLALGTGSHNINFANSSAVSWTANTLLTITGWTGTNNGASSGTAGRVFFGSGFGTLTGIQLSRIRFNISSVLYGAMQLSTGEVVPSGGQVLYYGGATGTWTGAVWGTAEGGPYTTAWTSGRHAIFNIASANTLTGATTNIAAITANANITYAAGGTWSMGPSGAAVAPIYVDNGVTFQMLAQLISTTAGNGLIKYGTGILQGGNGNAYTGGFTIHEGMFAAGGVNAMGDGGALIINGGTIAGTATRDFSNRLDLGITVAGNFTLGSSTAPALGTANLTFNNNTALGTSATRTITLGGTGLYTWSGIISGTSSNLTLAATAAGTLALGGVNTYGGNTTINGGTLRPTVAGALPTTTGLSFANTAGAILDLSTNGLAHSVVSISGGGSTGGNIAFGAATTTTLTANQSTNTTYDGLISGASLTTGGLVKTGTGILTLTNTGHTYLGTTTITNGELRLNPSSTTATFASQVVLNGGKLSSTAIATSTTWTSSSTLNLNANSTIDLGSNVHSLVFANSSAVTWAGSTLVINGWTGTGGVSGTAGKIFFGNTSGTLTGGQLAKISFTGFPGTPILLGTGELVPAVAGVTYTWDGSAGSSWTDPANWTPGTSVAGPTGSDNVIIPDVASYTTPLAVTGAQSCFDFTVQANGTYSIGAGASLSVGGAYVYSSSTAPTFDCTSTLSLAGSGTVTIPAHAYGNLNASGGDRILASSGTIGICGTFTRGAGAYTVTGSTVDFNGTGAQTLAAGTYNNLTISNNRSAATLTSPAGTIAVGGTFDVSTLSNYVASVNASSIFDFTAGVAQSIPAFFYGQLNNTGNGNRTWASSGIIDIGQGFTPGTGTHTITGSTVRYSNTAATTWNLTTFNTNVAGRQYNNLIFAGGASTNWSNNGITLGVAGNLNITSGTYIVGSAGGAGTLNVDGTFTFDGGTLNLSNSATNAGTINLTGNLVLTSGTFNKSGAATGTFNFSRASLTQTITQSAATVTNNGTTWNLGTGATTNTVQLASNISTGAGTINVRQNATLDFQSFEWSGTSAFTSTGTSPGATLISAHLSGINTSGASGSVRVSGTKTFSSGTNYTFNATSAQQSGTALNAGSGLTVRNLTINNPTTVTITSSGGSGNSTDAVQVTNQLDLQQGILILDTRDLQLNASTTIAGAPFSATKMIVTIGTSNRFNGRLIRTFNNGPQSNLTFTFPLGDITGTAEYTPFSITDLDYTTASGPFLGVKVKDNKAPFDPSVDNYLTRTFETTTGSSGLTTATGLNLAFDATYITGASDVVGNDALFRVNRFNWGTGTWAEDAGSTCGSGTLSTGASPITSGANINNHDIIGRLDAPIYFRSVTTGNWENPLTWEASTDPAFVTPAPVTPSIYPIYSNSAGVSIRSTHNVTITTIAALGGVPLDQTTVDLGGTLTVQSGSMITVQNGTGTDLTVDGTVVNQSTSAWLIVGGTVQFNSGSLYNHNTNSGTIPAATWNAASECRVTGTTTTAPAGIAQTFGNLTWNCPSMAATANLGGGTIGVAGDLKLENTNGGTLGFTATSALNLSVTGNLDVTGGFYTLCTGANASATTAAITGNVSISGSAGFGLTGTGATGAPGVTMTVGGNLTNNSTSGTSLSIAVNSKPASLSITGTFSKGGTGTMSLVQGSGAGSIAVAGLSAQISAGSLLFNNGGSGAATFNHSNAAGTFTLSGGQITMINTSGAPGTRPTLTIAGAFSQTNGNYEVSTAYTGALNPPAEILVGGNFTRSGTGYIRSTSPTNNARITFNGTSTYNTTGVSGNFTYHNMVVNATNTLTLASNLTFTQATATPTQTLTVNGILNCGTFVVDEAAAGSTFVLNTSGTLNIGSLAGIASSGATGNIQTSTRTFNAGTYIYSGNGNQITGSGLPATVASLEVANAGSAPNNVLTLNNTSSSTGALVLTSGILDLGTSNFTAASTSGYSSTRYVRTSGTGRLRMVVGTGDVVFPVGNSAYNPITLDNTGGTSDTYGVLVLDVITSPAPNDPTKLINRYWDVNEAVAGGSNLIVELQYNGGEENVNFASGSSLYMGNFPVSSWNQIAATTGGAGPFQVTNTSPFATVGTFGIGKDDGFINPLTIYTWTGLGAAGLWTDPNNWSPNTSVAGPLVGDDIIINAPGSGSNNLNITDARTISNVTFNGTGVLNIAATGSLTINGTVTYGGSFVANLNCSSTMNYNNPAALNIPPFNYGNLSNANGSARTWTAGATTGICGTLTTGTGSTFTAGAGSTVNYNGTGAQTIVPLAYANLTISNARSSANLTSPAGTISVSGVFDVSTLSAFTPVVDAASVFDFTSASAQTIPAFFYGQLNNTGNGNRTWASSGIIDIAQGFTPGAGTQSIAGSTIRYSNTSAGTWNLTNFTTDVAGRQYNNLEFVGGASTIWQPASAFSFGVDGNLTLSGAGRLNLNPNISLVTWTVDGNLSITGGGSLHGSTSSGNTNLNVVGNTSISNGSLFLVGASAGAGITATHNNTGTITVSGTGTYTLDAASNTALGIVNLTGDLSVTSTAANAVNLGSGTANANNVFNIGGNLTKSGTGTIGISGTFAPTARFVFNSGSTQTFDYSGAAMTAGNFEVASGTTLQLNSNLALGSNASASTLTVNGRLNTGTFTVSPGNAANDFVMGATGTLSCGSASGVSGNISGFAAGVPDFPAGVTFVFTGTAVNAGMSTYTGISSASNYTLNWEGTTSLTLDKSLSLSNLNFTNSGLILMGGSNLTLASGGTISGGPFSTSKMLVTNGSGSLFRSVLNTGVGLPFTWPIGETTGTTEFSPVTVNSIALAGINGTIGFRVVDGVHPDLALATSYLSRYWPCTVTGFNATYSLSNASFTYDSGTDVVVGPEASLRGNSYNGSTFDWSQYPSSSAGTNVLSIVAGMGGTTMPTAGPGTYDITGRIDVPVYYRTVSGGSWSTPGIWEISSDPAFAVPAPVTPVNPPTTANSDSVLILNTHTVNVNSAVAADQVAVKTGGVLNITTGGSYTLANGPGTADMRVDGNLLVATPFTIATGARLFVTNLVRQTVTGQIVPTGVMQIGATGTYEHATAAGASVVPTATWDVGSTCLLKYSGTTLPTGLGQAFHHFTLDADPGSTGAGGALTTVNGNLTLLSTGANNFVLGAGTSYTINVGGNVDVQGSSGLDVQSGGGTSVLNITGDLLQEPGTLITRSGSGTFTWNVTGNFTQSGGTFQLNVPSSTGNFNLRGNLTNDGVINAPSGVRNWNFIKTTGVQTFSQSGGSIANAFIWSVGNGTTTNTLQLASNVNLGTSGAGSFFHRCRCLPYAKQFVPDYRKHKWNCHYRS
jgi:fibronectin-binding autotransporter adhesin